MAGMLAASPVAAQETVMVNREYAIKAAFLYHFSTYVEWPADVFPADGEPFVIGVFHSDPFGGALDEIAKSKTVGGHPIKVRLLKSTEGISSCQILFIPDSVTGDQRAGVLRSAQAGHAFVVGETDDFIERGGDAQFFLEGNKVRFAFSEKTTKREDIKVSSKLLSLAKIVPAR